MSVTIKEGPSKELDIRRSIDTLENSTNVLTERLSTLYDKQSFVMSCMKQPEKENKPEPIDGTTPMSQSLNAINDRVQCNIVTVDTIINQTEF